MVRINRFFDYLDFLFDWLEDKHPILGRLLLVSCIVTSVVTTVVQVLSHDWVGLGITVVVVSAVTVFIVKR